MVTTIHLPELGESVAGGVLVAWRVAAGDAVVVGQAIAEVSTDKVDTEIPSPLAGTVTRLIATLESEIVVGEALLEIDVEQAAPPSVPSPSGSGTRAVAARTPAADLPAPGPRSGPPRLADAAPSRLSPLVRRLLRQHGIDPRAIAGTGQDGRITEGDVRAAIERGDARPTRPRLAPPPGGGPGATRTEPLSRMRKVIAQRMHDSIHTTAQLTAAVEADVTRIMALRSQVRDAVRARHGVSLSPMAFLAHATVRALAMHPLLNASIDVDAETMTLHAGVNLGIAVDAPNGLIVPVIHDAQDLGPVGLQQRIADLAERARTRRITPDDLAGGTFTITNTGSRGSLLDTPILNPPEVGILATPAIEKRPVVITAEDGTDRIAVRSRTYLCLTYDHRLVDGADAARFLTDLAALVDRDDWGPEVEALRG